MIRIFHLDDHRIFQSGVKTAVQKYIKDVEVKNAPDNQTALEYLRNCLERNELPDIIITDYNHPNGNGLEFINEYRKMETDFNVRIPILMKTMIGYTTLIQEYISDGLLDYYLNKTASEHRILSAIHNLLTLSDGYHENMKESDG